MALLQLKNITKTFNRIPAVDTVNLSVDQGNILCLLGPSGCGKTTLLRVIAGLEEPDMGKVIFDGTDMAGIAPHQRQFGMMFQEYALFPHKNVFENVAFGLEIQNRPAREVNRRCEAMLDLVGLQGFSRRNVNDLSGGERQRVALARSLAPQPRLLLLDDPLGALDRALRDRLMLDLRRILKQVDVTAIFVTHDHSEAFAVADEIAVMHNGRIAQCDRPENLYERPKNAVVARFLGFENLIKGQITPEGKIRTPLGLLSLPNESGKISGDVTVMIRPDAAKLVTNNLPPQKEDVRIRGTVTERIFKGSHFRLTVTTDSGQPLIFHLPQEILSPHPGQPIHLGLNPSGIVLMPGEDDSQDVNDRGA